jgi:hypothetical protein
LRVRVDPNVSTVVEHTLARDETEKLERAVAPLPLRPVIAVEQKSATVDASVDTRLVWNVLRSLARRRSHFRIAADQRPDGARSIVVDVSTAGVPA